MMNLHRLVFHLLLLTLCSAANPLTLPNGNLDPAAVASHILQLEQAVANLEAENRIQEQKQAAVLSSVLSKLTSTSDELLALKLEHNSTLIVLADYRNQIDDVQKQLGDSRTEHNNTLAELKLLKDECSSVNDSTRHVTNELSKLNKEFQTTKEDLMEAKSNLANITSQVSTKLSLTNITDTIKQSANMRVEIERRLNATESHLTKVQEQLVSTVVLSQGKRSKGVAFQVTQRRLSPPLSTTLKFDTVDTNIGGGYNAISGVFTAPVSGTYIFWANVMILKNNGNYYLNIFKENQSLARGYYCMAHSIPGVISTTTVTHLDGGDHVHFGMEKQVTNLNSEGSSYGGVLVHASGM